MLLAAVLMLPARESTAQTTPAAAASSTHRSRHSTKKPAPTAEVPQASPTPPTLEEQPPVPPQVTYRDGQLTITSTNATLAQVLRSVQTQTGATIDIPPGSGGERVVATLGPGKPQNVIASLLNGSKFNFVILGVPDKPGAVQKVILLAKSNVSASEAQLSAAHNNAQPPQPVESEEDEYPQNEPPVENQVPSAVIPTPTAEDTSPDGMQPGNRTPEQMLQELQRMQQQQQQLQEQLNPANQQPFGQPFNPSGQQQPIHSQAAPPQPQ